MSNGQLLLTWAQLTYCMYPVQTGTVLHCARVVLDLCEYSKHIQIDIVQTLNPIQ